MKSFRIVVALRLAIFPLAFNLTIADELEVVSEETSSWTTLSVANGEVKDPESDTLMDSHVTIAPQNDKGDIQDFYPVSGASLSSEWQEDIEFVISNECEKSTEQIECDTPMDFSLCSEW